MDCSPAIIQGLPISEKRFESWGCHVDFPYKNYSAFSRRGYEFRLANISLDFVISRALAVLSSSARNNLLFS